MHVVLDSRECSDQFRTTLAGGTKARSRIQYLTDRLIPNSMRCFNSTAEVAGTAYLVSVNVLVGVDEPTAR